MTITKKRIGVIGCGEWGPNQIRSFCSHPEATVVRICDLDMNRLKANKEIYPNVEITTNSNNITQAKDIDAVIICTPTSQHYPIAKETLLNGKDVLCEKPLTLNSIHAEELVNLADKNNLILMVGHIFLYNPGIIKLKELIKSKECGDVYYLYSRRTNLGRVRLDESVVYDLASHDVSIFNYLLDGIPKVISAVGKCSLRNDFAEVAFISLEYPRNIFVHLHISWLDPKKVREITVVGSKKMITWNDLMERPIEIYYKHIEQEQQYYRDYGEFKFLSKEGEILIPYVKNVEPLKLQTEHFIQCIKNRKQPLSNGASGLQVVKTLEEINEKLTVSSPQYNKTLSKY